MTHPPPPSLPPAKGHVPAPYLPDASLGLVGWAFLAGWALVSCAGIALASCTATQGATIEAALTLAGCELVAVIAGSEQVGTLCSDIAPAVEAELAALVADRDVKPDNLLGHRERTHRRPVRLLSHVSGRDPGETIEEGLPLEATLRVLRRRGLPAAPVADGGAR